MAHLDAGDFRSPIQIKALGGSLEGWEESVSERAGLDVRLTGVPTKQA